MSTLHISLCCAASASACARTTETLPLEVVFEGITFRKKFGITTFREKLTCCRDSKNTEGPFAVAVKRRTMIVSHASRIMSAACDLFLAKQRPISCTVSGHPVLVVPQLVK